MNVQYLMYLCRAIKQDKNQRIMSGCNCIKDVTERLVKHKQENSTISGYNIESALFDNVSIYPTVRMYSECNVSSTFTKKDGSTSNPKTEKVSIFFNFCPFCGVKYENKLIRAIGSGECYDTNKDKRHYAVKTPNRR